MVRTSAVTMSKTPALSSHATAALLTLLGALASAGCLNLNDHIPSDVAAATEREGKGGNGGGSPRGGNGGDSQGGAGGSAAGEGGAGGSSQPPSSCGAGTHACGSVCVSDSLPTSCGSSCDPCPSFAGATATCTDGRCGVKCPDGKKACRDACIPSEETCGAPACGAGTHDCDGLCVSNSAVTSCGTSCSACPAPPAGGAATCDGATCGFRCEIGKRCENRCGECCDNTDCPAQSGKAGTCDTTTSKCKYECKSGEVDCDGRCIPAGSCCRDVDCPMNAGKVGKCDGASNKCEYACAAGERCGQPGPCKRGLTTCSSPTSQPACNVENFDGAGGCPGGQHCQGGNCVADCNPGMCNGNPSPCRQGQISCPGGNCVDSATAANEGGACGGGNICRGGQCVAACKGGDPCVQGIGPCRRGTLTCASNVGQPECRDSGEDNSRQTCPAGQTCSNGRCATACRPDQPCAQGLGPCRRGKTFCASPTSAPECRDAGSSCGNNQVCDGGSCKQCGQENQLCCPGDRCAGGFLHCRSYDGGPKRCQACGASVDFCCDGSRCRKGAKCESEGFTKPTCVCDLTVPADERDKAAGCN